MSFNPSINTSERTIREKEKLETLFIKFSEEIDFYEKSKILYSVVEGYLQQFKNELETNVKSSEFLQLLSQAPLLCNRFLQISESTCVDEIVIKSKNLECAGICFNALLLCVEAFCMTEQCITMIKLALNILSLGYTHCKESEVIYGNLLEQFADQLGAFYKKIENLETVVLQHLDQLDMTNYDKGDVQINFIIVELGNLCQIIFSLDADISSELWTKYLRIITNHNSLNNVSNINEICAFLVSKNIDLLLSFKSSLENSSEEDEELAAKLYFYLDALSDLVNLIYVNSIENKLSFISILLKCLILCYSPFIAERTSLTIVKSSLKKNTFELVSHLCTDEEFVKSLPFLSNDVEFHLSIVLLKLCSLQCIENISLEFRENILKGILSDFLLIDADDNMKLLYHAIPLCALSKTKSDELVTLYQLVCDTITESLKLMSDSHIEKLESTILNHITSSSDVICLLISDAWIYRLRCSSIEFFKERCCAILHNLHKENINNYKIENLMKRMLQFLPSSDKNTLLEGFSSLKFIQESKHIQHRYGIPDHTSTENEIKICSEEHFEWMMCQLNENSSNDADNLIKKACICLELCTFLVNIAGCSEILQFLELSSELFKTDIYEIQIATLSFLKSLSRKNMPEHNHEFGKIATILAQMFSETMHSKNYIVRYEARNIFSYFAKCTPHVKIVQETIKKNTTLKHILKSYMNLVPENNFLSEKEKEEYLQKQILMSRNIKFEISPEAVEALQKLFSKANWKLLI